MFEGIGNIGNYYGGLSIKQEGSLYFWGIENYNGTYWEEIPKELYDMLMKHKEPSDNGNNHND